GGGQPCLATDEVRALRAKGLYTDDEKATIRMSHLNPEVKSLYDDYLGGKTGAQGSEKAHHLLHTCYKKLDLYKFS
ncbi:MAG: iron hydrogenase small subunit, partial [Kiritimatiellae bacterium]|nr:iron hydrogenase small subunit [Kiritimatiellia bacterium]